MEGSRISLACMFRRCLPYIRSVDTAIPRKACCCLSVTKHHYIIGFTFTVPTDQTSGDMDNAVSPSHVESR